ncbi:adenylate/guanylate cyclase domain-containing protein [Candidatus Kaiserbacteria bacterium]|nr:adenylate/guanylate cyclase domain-containing protein [Candidatus Kaiserbacteria bacterium]
MKHILRSLLGSRIAKLSVIVAASAVLSTALFWYGTFDSWQEKLLDRFFVTKEPGHNIVIIGIDERSIDEVGPWPWPRATLGKLLEGAQDAALIGVDISMSDASRAGTADDAAFATVLARMPSRVVLPVQVSERGRIITEPLALFGERAREGFINVSPDSDSIVRRAPAALGEYPSFAHALVSDDTPSRYRIDYRGPEGTFLTVPASEVLRGTIPARVFADAIVLVGATAPSLNDTVLTPFGEMPGVEFHANNVATILDGAFYTERSLPWSLGMIVLVHAAVLACILYIRRFLYLGLALVGVLATLFLGSIALFIHYIVLPVLYAAVGYALSLVTTLSFQYLTESKEKRFIRNSFQYYLTPDVIDEIIRDPGQLALGGVVKKITVFFSDIRGFTAISEGLSPAELTQLLNEYLTAMTDIVMDEHGVVDKYIGDAVMAFWGAPLENAHQARDACRAAVKMSRTLAELNVGWEARGQKPMRIGMGINLGDLVVGNMGSQKRFNYTLMGDEVNFASRLEGLTKYYGVECLISESVQREIADVPECVTRELDTVVVKGKTEPKKIFELVTRPLGGRTRKAHALFACGRAAYLAGKWDDAIVAFREAAETCDDGPSRAFLERCEALQQHPPADWKGIYEFTSK